VNNRKSQINRHFSLGDYATCLPSEHVASNYEKGPPVEFLISVFGVVMIVEGVPWFLSPSGYKRILLQVLPLGDRLLRLLGLSLMLTGLFLVYLVKG
jgi:uncharacterized protein YjeT (DUF2065 family)